MKTAFRTALMAAALLVGLTLASQALAGRPHQGQYLGPYQGQSYQQQWNGNYSVNRNYNVNVNRNYNVNVNRNYNVNVNRNYNSYRTRSRYYTRYGY